MDYTQLILALISASPQLVAALENLFKQNPRQQDETDAAYATRLNAATMQLIADTTATDNSVSGDGGPVPVQTPAPAAEAPAAESPAAPTST